MSGKSSLRIGSKKAWPTTPLRRFGACSDVQARNRRRASINTVKMLNSMVVVVVVTHSKC